MTEEINIDGLNRRDRQVSVGFTQLGEHRIRVQQGDSKEDLIERAAEKIESRGLENMYGMKSDDAFYRADTPRELAKTLVNRWQQQMEKKQQKKKENRRRKGQKRLAKTHLAERAAETGEKQLFQTEAEWCDDPSLECNTDIVRTYILPNGDIDTERLHSY